MIASIVNVTSNDRNVNVFVPHTASPHTARTSNVCDSRIIPRRSHAMASRSQLFQLQSTSIQTAKLLPINRFAYDLFIASTHREKIGFHRITDTRYLAVMMNIMLCIRYNLFNRRDLLCAELFFSTHTLVRCINSFGTFFGSSEWIVCAG